METLRCSWCLKPITDGITIRIGEFNFHSGKCAQRWLNFRQEQERIKRQFILDTKKKEEE